MKRERPGMTTTATAFAGICATAAATSCASPLHRSQVDRQLGAIGTYACPPQARPAPASIEPDATQARCYRDRWLMDADEVRWVRSVFSDPLCANAPIGVAERRWSLKTAGGDVGDPARLRLRLVEARSTTLERLDPDWFYDQRLGCDLRQRPLRQPFAAASVAGCSQVFVDGPSGPRVGDAVELEFDTRTSDPEAPYQKLTLLAGVDGRRAPPCAR